MKKLLIACIIVSSVQVVAQTPITTTPFKLFGDHIFIEVSIDGSEPLNFIFDSGDGLSVVDLDVAKSLNLNMDHKSTTKGADGEIRGALIKHNKVEINNLVMVDNIKVYATTLNHLEISIGTNVDGIIGYDLLNSHTVRIDYDNMIFEIYDQTNFPIKGDPLSFKLHNSIPTVSCTTILNNGESIEGTYYLNTGAGTTMDFNTPFANANKIIDKTGNHYSYVVKSLSKSESKHYEGRVTSFKFGNNTFNEMPIGISQVTMGIQGDNNISGIIGNKLLQQFNITFDLKGSKVYLEKNKSFGKKLMVNCSGIDIQLSEDRSSIMIHQVYENSPASKAEVNVNDELISINGKSVSMLNIPEIEEMLKKDGESIKLIIKRDGIEKEVSILLKQLL